jgi:hypothetical protein
MFSKTDSSDIRSAAWRISLWATLAFAIGTMLVFAELHGFVAHDIQRRSDAWLSGEIETIGDVAEHTPKDRLYSRVMGEVAELASREVPDKDRSQSINDSVFFLQAGSHGVQLWVGAGNGEALFPSASHRFRSTMGAISTWGFRRRTSGMFCVDCGRDFWCCGC